jgi:hypothetical protein
MNETDLKESNKETISNDTPSTDSPSPKKRRRPGKKLIIGGIIALLVIAGLATGGYFGYQSYNSLSTKNSELQKLVTTYSKDHNSELLNPVSSDTNIGTDVTNTSDASQYANIVQTNTDVEKKDGIYLAGDYAPYWLLKNYAVKVPAGLKMQRTVGINTNGQLNSATNEGGAGCTGGDGITMNVSSVLSDPTDASLQAAGGAATYPVGLGCAGVQPASVTFVKYTDLSGLSDHAYRYLEIAIDLCPNESVNSNYDGCVNNAYDKSQWEFYSGIVPSDSPQFKVGDSTDPYLISKQLYNRTAKQPTFQIKCDSGDALADGTENFTNCSSRVYKSGDYQALMSSAAYTKLKSSLVSLHTF